MALTAQALRLSAEERLKMMEEVWESFAAEPTCFPVSGQEMKELERRRERYAADPGSLIDWQEMKSRLQQQRSDAH